MRLTAESIQCPDNLKYLAALLKKASSPPSHHLYILLIGHSLLLRQLESTFCLRWSILIRPEVQAAFDFIHPDLHPDVLRLTFYNKTLLQYLVTFTPIIYFIISQPFALFFLRVPEFNIKSRYCELSPDNTPKDVFILSSIKQEMTSILIWNDLGQGFRALWYEHRLKSGIFMPALWCHCPMSVT